MTTLQVAKAAELSPEKQEMLEQWRAHQSQPKGTRYNTIKIDNNSTLKEEIDGKIKARPNPNFGKVFAYKQLDDGTEEVTEIEPDKHEMHLVRTRVAIGAKDWEQYYIPEVDPFKVISIFNRKDKTFVKKDFYKNLKEEYDLQYGHALYVYFKGDMYRWKLGGSASESIFNLDKELNRKDYGNIPLSFLIKEMHFGEIGTVTYYFPEFMVGNVFDIELAMSLLTTLNASFLEFDNRIANQIKEQVNPTMDNY